MKREHFRDNIRALSLIFATLLFSQALQAQTSSDTRLEQAIATLRHVKRDNLSEAEQEKKAQEIDGAWAVIKAAGQTGVSRLKEEVRRVDSSNERDDYFKLNASALLWLIGQLDEAESIAAIWNSTPLDAQYNYVFYTAFEAATTQDLRALPMLKAVLRDKKGKVYFERHAMEVKWPLTHEFIWGAFGSKGLPALNEILKTSKDVVEQASATLLLAHAQYLPALPRIRELAATGEGEARLVAIQFLGVYGHPQDYEFLISGLSSKDSEVVWRHVYALYEYGDLRAVPLLIPLLETKDVRLKMETMAALTNLLTPASLEALQKHSQTAQGRQIKEALDEWLHKDAKINWPDYLKMSAEQREKFVTSLRNKREDSKYKLQPGEKGYSQAEFLRAAAEWKRKHRMEETSVSEILSGATAADIELLLDVKATFYTRLSDEAMYEVERIDEAVKYLGRSRYRKVPGITDRVEGL